MKLDLHLHTTFSYQGEFGRKESDSIIQMDDLPTLARNCGLDGLVVTDHMTVEAGNEIFQEIQKKNPDLLLWCGMEYHSDHGHLLLLGIEDDTVCRQFGKYGPIQPVIDFVNQRGGIAVPSHPYETRYTYPLLDHLFYLRDLAAVETVNGHLDDALNKKAAQAARRLSLPGIGGSDAHHPEAVGRAYTEFPNPIRTMKDLVSELRKGNCSAAKGGEK